MARASAGWLPSMEGVETGARPHLRGYQLRVLRSLVRGVATCPGETFTVMFPRQSGKNEISAALVAWLLLDHARSGGTVIVCAPTLYPQASISLDRTAAALQRQGLPAGRGVGRRDNVLTVGRARAIFLSASPHAHVAGHTASLALIGDEAQNIDADWFNRQFRPMAASTGAPTVLFGTPWAGDSLLETAAARNRARDGQGGPQRFHHQVSWQDVAASVPGYGDYVRQERDRLGAEHPLFVTQYELRTVQSAGRLLSDAQVARVLADHEPLTAPVRGERYVAGLDFGGDGAGADATVLVIARVAGETAEVVRVEATTGAPYETVIEEIAAVLQRWRPAMVCADGTGLGGPLVDALQRRVTTPIDRVTFTPAMKADLGYGLVAAAETGRLRLHGDDGSPAYRQCVAELRSCRAWRSGGGFRWGDDRGSDDHVVALALCARALGAAGPKRVAAGRTR